VDLAIISCNFDGELIMRIIPDNYVNGLLDHMKTVSEAIHPITQHYQHSAKTTLGDPPVIFLQNVDTKC
jgi:hypothetical protein